MKKIFKPFDRLFDYEHIFTPVAVEVIYRHYPLHAQRVYRLVYIFGVRVAYFAIPNFKRVE